MPARTSEEAARDAVMARLEQIRTSNGYRSDAGAKVYQGWVHSSRYADVQGKTAKPDAQTAPWLAVTELDTFPADEGEFTARTNDGPYIWIVNFLVEGFLTYVPTDDSAADEETLRALSYAVRADIRQALLAADFDADVDYVQVNGCQIDEREGGTRTAVVIYSVQVGVSECSGIRQHRGQ